MNDLLQRMLAVDQEAETIVQQAESEAAQLSEQMRQQINRERQEAQLAVQQECDKLLQAEIAKAHREAEEILRQDELNLERRKTEFAARIAIQFAPVREILLGGR